MKHIAAATLMALTALALVQTRAAAQGASVRNLRVAADESGAALPESSSQPGEKQYHLDSGATVMFIAYDCLAPSDGRTQVRLMQPPGAVLFQQDGSCAAGGTQVVKYEPEAGPFADNEYVVNLYVGEEELYLADSVQLTVGSAVIPESDFDAPTAAPGTQPSTNAPVATVAVIQGGSTDSAGAPSGWLLAVAGLGILGLVGVVLWAGWSATRR